MGGEGSVLSRPNDNGNFREYVSMLMYLTIIRPITRVLFKSKTQLQHNIAFKGMHNLTKKKFIGLVKQILFKSSIESE